MGLGKCDYLLRDWGILVAIGSFCNPLLILDGLLRSDILHHSVSWPAAGEVLMY